MEFKDKVSVWAGILTLAFFQAEDRFNAQLTNGDSIAAVGTLVGYPIGFVIVYFVAQWLLERYFKRKSAIPTAGLAPQQTVP